MAHSRDSPPVRAVRRTAAHGVGTVTGWEPAPDRWKDVHVTIPQHTPGGGTPWAIGVDLTTHEES